MSSVKYNVERRALARWRELESPTMRFLDDPSRQGEPDPPSRLLRREAGLEHAGSELTRDAGPVIGNTDPHLVIGSSFRGDLERAAATGESVDRILGHRLERPFQQHRVSLYDQRALPEDKLHLHGMRQRRHASLEIPRDTLRELRDIDGAFLGRTANALETMRHTLEAIEIAAHVLDRPRGSRVRSRAIGKELDPPGQARERRRELMRRLASHARPDPLAIRAPTRAKHVHSGKKDECDEQRLERRNEAEALHESRVAEMDRANRRLDQRGILAIENGDVLRDPRIID